MNIRSSIMNQLSLQGGAMIRKDAANIEKLEKDSTAAKQGEGCVDPLTGGFISKEKKNLMQNMTAEKLLFMSKTKDLEDIQG